MGGQHQYRQPTVHQHLYRYAAVQEVAQKAPWPRHRYQQIEVGGDGLQKPSGT